MTEKKGIFGFLKGLTATKETDGGVTIVGEQDKKSESLATNEIVDFAVERCQTLLTLAGFEGAVKLRHKKNYTIHLDIFEAGNDLGRIIGKNGSCLQALQLLIKFFIIRKFEVSLRLIIDAGDYKSKHQSQIKRFALKRADEVIATGAAVSLEPMAAPDRRVIHLLFENHNDIITTSEGEGEQRHIILMKRNDVDN